MTLRRLLIIMLRDLVLVIRVEVCTNVVSELIVIFEGCHNEHETVLEFAGGRVQSFKHRRSSKASSRSLAVYQRSQEQTERIAQRMANPFWWRWWSKVQGGVVASSWSTPMMYALPPSATFHSCHLHRPSSNCLIPFLLRFNSQYLY